MALNWMAGNAQSMREACAGTYKTEASLQALIIAALYAAVATGELFTTTVSTSGLLNQDVQNCMRDLIASGFGVSLAVSTLTITW